MYAIRDITPQDKGGLVRLHSRLSGESLYRRFHGAKGELTAGDLRYLTEIDHDRHVAIVAEQPDGELIGVARSVATSDDGREAEMAIVVRDDVQHDGVGHVLVDELRERAAQAGVEWMTAEVQADNHRALRFFQGLGARQRAQATGTICPLVFDLVDEGPALY